MGSTTYPDPETFRSLARRHRRVPVWIELNARGLTPPDVYARLPGGRCGFILEGVSPEPGAGRYSYVAGDVREVVRTGAGEPEGCVNPVSLLRQRLAALDAAWLPGLPEFHAGAVGYIGYEAARHFEPVVEPLPPDPTGSPEAAFFLPDEFVAVDNWHGRLLVVVLADCAAAGTAQAACDAARLRAAYLAGRLESGPPMPPLAASGGDVETRPALAPTPDRRAYERMVEQVREAVIAGELIQAVVTQRQTRRTDASPFAIYRALRELNPSPYMYLLDYGDFQLIGASPELLVRVRRGVASIHPIAGTRPRGESLDADIDFEEELLGSEKERAEHVMLLDLARNDLGRVCAPGTVRVTRQMAVERYSHVMHLVSRVEGRLRAGRDALDAFAAGFPAGTLAGAPKVRAMQLIRDLEPEGRGPYTGGVGWFGCRGDIDTGTVIRSIVLRDGLAHVQGGGGIVFDSVPEAEYREARDKIEAPLRAIALAESAGRDAAGRPDPRAAPVSGGV